jgi:uncharacterized membrane protein
MPPTYETMHPKSSTRNLDFLSGRPTITPRALGFPKFPILFLMSGSPTSNPGSDTGLASNLASGLCALFPLIGGIIFYFIEKKDQLVRHWAVQGIFFGGTSLVVSIVLSIIGAILIHIGILGVLLMGLVWFVYYIGWLILWILGLIKAFQGARWEYPIISAQCKKLFPKLVP